MIRLEIKKVQYDINKEAAKVYEKNMNILQVKKYCLLIKDTNNRTS